MIMQGGEINLIPWDESAADGGWRRWAPREEISPALEAAGGRLEIRGNGVEYVFGGWMREAPVDPEAEYAIEAAAEFSGVRDPGAAIWMLVRWRGDVRGSQAAEVVRFEAAEGGVIRFRDLLKAPAGAAAAVVYLVVRWAPQAQISWRDMLLAPNRAPRRRRVIRVTTVYCRPDASKASVENNVEGVLEVLDAAAAGKPDIVLLPDAITAVGVFSEDLEALTDTVPGRIHDAVAARAAKYGMYVVYTIYERSGAHIFATGVLVDRAGKIAGKHRKTQPPVSEAMRGFAPGDSLEVFETDFGRVGILICGETLFPETARVLALKGAEMIFVPIWGGFDELLVARAIENGLWLVTSGYDTESMIINPLGEIIARTWKKGGGSSIISAVIDLEERFRHFYPGGFPGYYRRLRRPALYGPVTAGSPEGRRV